MNNPRRNITNRRMVQSAGRVLIGCFGSILILFATQSSLASQERIIPLREAIEDKNADGAPDRLDQVVKLRGVLLARPYLSRRATQSVAYLQDESAGMQLRSPDHRLVLEDFEQGEIVEVRGRVRQTGRRVDLDLQKIMRVGDGKLPVPVKVSAADLRSDRYMGQLIRITGHIRSPEKLDEYPPKVTLADSSGEVFLYISNRLLRDREFSARLSRGGRAEIVGIVQNSEGLPPYNAGNQVRPRGAADILFPPAPPFKEVALGILVCLGLALGFHLWLRRRDAEKTVKQLTALGESLRQSEEALRESNQKLEAILRSSPLAIVTRDLQGKVRAWNPAAERMFGWSQEEMLGSPLPVVPEDEMELFHENEHRLSAGETILLQEVRPQRKDGSRFDASLALAPLYDKNRRMEGAMAILQDITVKKEWNARLLRVQKMEAIGQLAGGVAHDFNNSIGAILGWAEFALDEVDPQSPLAKSLNHILKQARHATDLTRELVALSRRQTLEKQAVELNSTVEQTLSLLGRLLPADIGVSKSLAPDLPTVLADPTQLERVLMNLCLNAKDAMPGGGKLRIETEQARVDEDYCRRFTNAKPGDYAVLSISDTGTGMDPQTLSRIFEPFFTTKQAGKGTGLGLAVVYGIVEQHGGFINVYSELGEGTTFRIYLPVSNGAAKQQRQETATALTGGDEVILLAEDHDGYRGIAKHTLENLGYRVLAASDGNEALRMFQHYKEEIRLAILDVVMPGLRGPEVHRRMCAANPSLPVIFVSGYSSESDSLISSALKHVVFLQKPYNLKALSRKVRELLDQKATEGPLPCQGVPY